MTSEELEDAMRQYEAFRRKYAFRRKWKDLKQGKMLRYYYPDSKRHLSLLNEVMKIGRKPGNHSQVITQHINLDDEQIQVLSKLHYENKEEQK